MSENYLLLASSTYAFPILRPLQDAIRARGGNAAWFLDNPACRAFLKNDETELRTVREVLEFSPRAVFVPVNDTYHFFPGIQVQVFHGFAIGKRGNGDSHFRHAVRGWFDLYCVNDMIAMDRFERLSREYGNFKAVATGWPKLDRFGAAPPAPAGRRPVILYSSTFTEGITSAPLLFDQIERLATAREWDWIVTFHPLMAPETVERYKRLADRHDNVTFYDGDDNVAVMERADAMLCDTSSIIMEFMYLGKPVVTFRNTRPDDSLINITDTALLEGSLETALSRPDDLMRRIGERVASVHPWRDGKSSERVLEAVDDFIEGRLGGVGPKKISLLRRIKARARLRYWGGLSKGI